jgi:TRAP-type C4-dicarboxylate transport system substrate-binding protein
MRQKKTYLVIMALCIGVLINVALSPVCQAADKITLKAISAWPKSVFEVQNFMKFIDMAQANVAQKYPGELEVKYIGGPEVIPNREQVEALRKGLVDVVFTTVGYYASIIPEADAMNLTPMHPWEEREKGVNDFLNRIHQEKANAYYLGRLGTEIPFTMHLNKSISSADLTGLKIRCSPTHIGFLKKLGAQPLVIPPPDVYTSLERGLADGFIWPAGLIRDWGWQEVTKYIIQPSFYNAINVVLVNLDAWNKLPEHLQELLIETEKEAEHYAVERGQTHVRNEFVALQKLGLQIVNLPPAEARKLTDAAYSSMWQVVLEKSPQNGAELQKLLNQ